MDTAALRLSVSARRRPDPADGRRQSAAVPRRAVSAREPKNPEGHEAAGRRGFPGETEQDFQALLDWLEEAELDRVGCFRYEPVHNAAANALPNAVPEELKEERWHRFMAAQQVISARRLQRRVGFDLDVIVDELEGDQALGRSMADAPEIDGRVYLPAGKGASKLKAGSIVKARVTSADEYDLWAEPVG